MDGKSLDITEERLNKLKEILPDAFTEGKMDWEKLQASLGEDIEFKNERYVLNWAGKSDAFRVLQSSSITEIGKERICRVIEKIKADKQTKLDVDGATGKQDLGFKVFKLQQSNFKIWRSDVKTEEELYTQLKLHTDPVDENAKIENILYELLLKSGVPLTARIEEKDGYYLVNDDEIALILKKIDESIIKAVISEKPKNVITLDRLFKNNDQLKTNTALLMKDVGIEFKAV